MKRTRGMVQLTSYPSMGQYTSEANGPIKIAAHVWLTAEWDMQAAV